MKTKIHLDGYNSVTYKEFRLILLSKLETIKNITCGFDSSCKEVIRILSHMDAVVKNAILFSHKPCSTLTSEILSGYWRDFINLETCITDMVHIQTKYQFKTGE